MKKTIIAMMALAGVAMGADYTGTFGGKSFVTTGALTLSEFTCTPDTYKTPSFLGEGITEATYIAPDINMNAGSWTLSFKITNESAEDITLDSVIFDAFMFTGAGNQHENDGVVRQVSFTLGGDFAGTVTKEFTGKNANNQNYRDTDADANIRFSKPITIVAGGYKTLTLTVAKGAENAGSYVGLKGATFSTPAVPEPTTATLSLLALAGLAARRRRK